MSVISPEEKRQPVTLRTTFWIPLPQRVRHTVLIMETANLQVSIHAPVKGATHRLDEKLDDVISENRTQNEKLDRIEKNTAGLVNAFEAGKGTVKVGKWIGGLLIFLCSVGTAVASFWDAIVRVIEKGG